jgi:hypothetical protein
MTEPLPTTAPAPAPDAFNLSNAAVSAQEGKLDDLNRELAKAKDAELQQLLVTLKASQVTLSQQILASLRARVETVELDRQINTDLARLERRRQLMALFAQLPNASTVSPQQPSEFSKFVRRLPGGEWLMNLLTPTATVAGAVAGTAPALGGGTLKTAVLSFLANPLPIPGLERFVQIPWLTAYAKQTLAVTQIQEYITLKQGQGRQITFAANAATDGAAIKSMLDANKDPRTLLEAITRAYEQPTPLVEPLSISMADIADSTGILARIATMRTTRETTDRNTQQTDARRALAVEMGLPTGADCQVRPGTNSLLEVSGTSQYTLTFPVTGDLQVNPVTKKFIFTADQQKVVDTFKSYMKEVPTAKKIEVVTDAQPTEMALTSAGLTLKVSGKSTPEQIKTWLGLIRDTQVKKVELSDDRTTKIDNIGTDDIQMKVSNRLPVALRAGLIELAKRNNNSKITSVSLSQSQGSNEALYTDGTLQIATDGTVLNNLASRWDNLVTNDWSGGDKISTVTWTKNLPSMPVGYQPQPYVPPAYIPNPSYPPPGYPPYGYPSGFPPPQPGQPPFMPQPGAPTGTNPPTIPPTTFPPTTGNR